MAKKKKFDVFKKVVFVSTLTLLSVAASGSMMVYANTVTQTDVTALSDIDSSYRSSEGYSNVSQEQETSDTGLISTTIKAQIDLTNNPGIQPALSSLQEDITDVSNGELVNLDLKLIDKDRTFSTKFYSSSAEDYNDTSFNKVINVLEAAYESDLKTYDVTVRPGLEGRNIKVVASTNGFENSEKDSKIQLMQQRVLSLTNDSLQRTYGDVFDVTYENKKVEDTDTTIPLTVQTIFNSDYSYETANKIDFGFLNNLVEPGKYSAFTPVQVKYVVTPTFNSGQLIIVVPDEGDEKLNQISQSISSYVSNDIVWVPEAFDVLFRYSIDGTNKLTFNTYYAG
jgi:hypothetical protein